MTIRHRHALDDDHHIGFDQATATVLSSSITGGLGTFAAGTTVQSLLASLVSQVTDAEVQRRDWILANAVRKATITPPPQGDTWTFYPRTIGTDDPVGDAAYDITHGEGYWVISLASGIHYSLDATDDNSWTGPVDHDGTNVILSLKYNGVDRWVGVGGSRNVTTATTVAGPWTAQQFSPDYPTFPQTFGQWEDVEYGNGLWTIVGGIGTTQGNGGYYTSTDGQNWTARSGIPWGRYTFAIKYAAGLWVAVGYNQDGSGNGGIATTTDPTTGSWTHAYVTNTTPLGTFLWDVDYGNGLWTAVGLQTGAGGGVIVVTSPDGITWTKRIIGDFTMLAGDPQSIAYGGGNWVIVGRADDFDYDVKVYHAEDPTTDTFVAADGAAESNYNWAAHYENGIWAVIGEDWDVADVHLVTTADPTSLAPTADAFIVLLGTGGLSADATLRSTISSSLTANAVISTSSSGGITADATLSIGRFDAFTADAYIASTAVAGSFTGDAVVLRIRTDSLTADAVIGAMQAGTFTADASITLSINGNFTGSAVILWAANGSFTGNAVVFRTQSGSVTGDAFIPGRFFADAVINAGGDEGFQSDVFQSDAFQMTGGGGAEGGDLTADAVILRAQIGSLTGNAVVRRATSGSATADAYVAGGLTANAVALAIIGGSLTANAFVSGRFSANAFIAGRITADAVIDNGAGSEDFQSDAFQSDAFE